MGSAFTMDESPGASGPEQAAVAIDLTATPTVVAARGALVGRQGAATWLLAAGVTGAAVLASVLLPQ